MPPSLLHSLSLPDVPLHTESLSAIGAACSVEQGHGLGFQLWPPLRDVMYNDMLEDGSNSTLPAKRIAPLAKRSVPACFVFLS